MYSVSVCVRCNLVSIDGRFIEPNVRAVIIDILQRKPELISTSFEVCEMCRGCIGNIAAESLLKKGE